MQTILQVLLAAFLRTCKNCRYIYPEHFPIFRAYKKAIIPKRTLIDISYINYRPKRQTDSNEHVRQFLYKIPTKKTKTDNSYIKTKTSKNDASCVGFVVFSQHGFDLGRKTGEVLGVIDRGNNSVNTLLSYILFTILPTFADIFIAIGYFVFAFNLYFGLMVFLCMAFYIGATVLVSEWRTKYKRETNKLDNQTRTKVS